jgi:3-oxoadipate enol-lactonase
LVAQLNYLIEGSGRGVVLLHPVGLDLTFLDPLAKELARRYAVLRVDHRGHGRSPTMLAPSGLDDYADDLHALLAKLKFAPAAVVGFSFGGMVAQALALRHAADVAALVPCACPGTLTPEARATAEERAADAERNGMVAVVEATLKRWFTPEFLMRGGAIAARKRLLADDPKGWAEAWRAIAKIDALPRLSGLRVPALALAGERDVASPPATLRAIADAIPGGRYAELAGAPHMLFIEQPKEVARVIGAFLDEALR